MAGLEKRDAKVRVLGLYWDQGNAYNNRGKEGEAFGKNLAHLIERLRRDTGQPRLNVFIRKHFYEAHVPYYREHVIEAQVEFSKQDPNCFLIDIDRGSNDANYYSWSCTVNTDARLYLSGRAYLEIANRIVDRRHLARRAARKPVDGSSNTTRPAIVFLVAGQSNANGGGLFRRQDNIDAGVENFAPALRGTTAEDLGLPLTSTEGAYGHSFIWPT